MESNNNNYKKQLLVRTSKTVFEPFDRSKIVRSLLKETDLKKRVAQKIAKEVEDELSRLKLDYVTAPLIREIVNVKLLEQGLERERAKYTRLGMPVHDVKNLIEFGSKENANLQYNPESVPYDEEVLVKINGETKIVKIGEIVEKVLKENPEKIVIKGNSEIVKHIEKIPEIRVYAFNEQQEVGDYKITAFIRNGPNEIYEITTRSGRKVRTTPYHSLFTIKNGNITCIETSQLKPGDPLAVPYRIRLKEQLSKINLYEKIFSLGSPMEYYLYTSNTAEILSKIPRSKLEEYINKRYLAPPRTVLYWWRKKQKIPISMLKDLNYELSTDELKKAKIGTKGSWKLKIPTILKLKPSVGTLLGYLISEGTITQNRIDFNNSKLRLHKEFANAFKQVFNCKPPKQRKNGGTLKTTVGGKALVKILSVTLGLEPKRASEKEIPPLILSSPHQTITAFLKAYLKGDGHVKKRTIGYTTSSYKIAQGLTFLLLTKGIYPKIYRNKRFGKTYYEIGIYGTENLNKASRELNIKLHSQPKISRGDKIPTTNIMVEEIYHRLNNQVRDLLFNLPYNVNLPTFYSKINQIIHEESIPTRKTLGQLIDISPDIPIVNDFRKLVIGDIYWDEVKEIKLKGQVANTYDLEVKPNGREIENFIGGSGFLFLHNSVHKLMADQIAREYALINLIPLELADAHMSGEMHIHDLDYFVRPFCFSHDIRFFLKNGFKADGVGNHTAIAGPAKRPEVAFLHAAKVLAASQTNSAGGQGFSYFNTFLAPYVQGLEYKKIKQLAQMFIYELSVDGEEKIPILDNGEFKIIKIGDFVDKLVNNSEEVLHRGYSEIVKLEGNYKVLSFDKTGVVRFLPITGVSRHKTNQLYEITTKFGKKVRVTGYHSLFTFNGEAIIPIRAEELNEGDYVVGIKNIDVSLDKDSIDLYNELCKLDRTDLRVTNLGKLIQFLDKNSKEVGDSFYVKELLNGKRTISFGKLKKLVEKYAVPKEIIDELLVTSSTYSKKKYYLPLRLPISNEFLRLIGYYLAEGYLNKGDEGMGVGLGIDHNQVIKDDVNFCVKKVFNAEIYEAEEYNLRFGGKLGVILFRDILKIGEYSINKKLPDWVLILPKYKLREVIRAYTTSDGFVSDAQLVSISTSSKELIDQLRFIFLKFGIVTRHKISRFAGEKVKIKGIETKANTDSHVLYIGDMRSAQKYLNEIGFVNEKFEKLIRILNSKGEPQTPEYMLAPFDGRMVNVETLSCNPLKHDLCMEKIIKIEKVNIEKYVYDLEIEPTQNFCTISGLTLHNSQMYVARGGQVVFSSIDCDMSVPEQFQDIPAVLPGGKVKDRITYGDFEDEVNNLFNAIVDVYLDGDYIGKPFNFPKFEVQIYPEKIKKKEHEEKLMNVSKLAAKFGTPYYIINQPYMPQFACYQCLPPDERILVKKENCDVRLVKISDVEVGDKVFTFSELDKLNGEIKIKPIIRKFEVEEKKPLYEILLKDGRKIKCSHDHHILVFSDEKWVRKSANDVKPGDSLPSSKLTSIEIKCKEKSMESEKIKVYANGSGFSEGINLIEVKKVKKIGKLDKWYDIEVEDNHNFLLENGIFVSNCCSFLMPLDSANTQNDVVNGTIRGGGLQVVTINLPQIAYEANGNDDKLFELLKERMEKAKQVLLLKREVIKKNLKNNLLPFMNQKINEKEKYLEVDKQSYIIGLVGMNEMVKAHLRKELHESEDAWKFALKVMKKMKEIVAEFRKETKLNFSLARTPAESSAYRLAQIDLKKYGKKAITNGVGETAYYTNSFHVRPSANVPLWERLKIEGAFHALTDGGAMCLNFNEKILVKKDNPKERNSAIFKIGEFVEDIIENSPRKVINLTDGSKVVDVSDLNYYTLGMNKNFNSCLSQILKVMKIPKVGTFFRLKTAMNKTLKAIDNHRLFILENGKISEKYVKDLRKDDTILVLNNPEFHATYEFNFLPHILKYKEDITIINLDEKTINLKRLIEKIGLEKVEQLAKENKIRWKLKRTWNSYPFILKLDRNFGELIGFMISEGFKTVSKKTERYGNYNIGATFGLNEREYARRFVRLFKMTFGVNMKLTRRKNTGEIICSISDKTLYSIFSESLDIGKNARERKIPNTILLSNKDVLMGIVDAAFAGDGTKDLRKRYIRYDSTSKELIDNLSLVCSLVGYPNSKTKIKRDNRRVYSLSILRDTHDRMINNSKQFIKKLDKIPLNKSSMNGYLINYRATPFKALHNYYLRRNGVGRYLKENFKLKLYLQHEPRITVEKAKKVADEWLEILNKILNFNSYTLLRFYHADKISQKTKISKRVVQSVLLMAEKKSTYVKTKYFSHDTFKKIISFYTYSEDIKNKIVEDIQTLLNFKDIIEKNSIGFDTIKEISKIKQNANFVYDVTMENGKFFTTEGILNHNSHIWLSEQNPSPKGIFELTKKIATETAVQYYAFTKDLSVCLGCNFTVGGLIEKCPNCGSKNIDWWSRITGYYQNISGWNKGKLAELKDRRRYTIQKEQKPEELSQKIKRKIYEKGINGWRNNLDF